MFKINSLTNNLKNKINPAKNVARYALENKISPQQALANIGRKHSRVAIATGDTLLLTGGALKLSAMAGLASLNPFIPCGIAAVGLYTGNLGRFGFMNSSLIKNMKKFTKSVVKEIPQVTEELKKAKHINIFV